MVLDLRSIQKRFGGVQALRRGDLRVQAGEVHLLLGENGAGKSTLMKIVAGMQSADGGEFLWKGQPARFRSPAEAQRAGIAMVHQESLLAPHLSVAENLYLGREPRRWMGWIDRGRAVREAARLIEEHRFPLQAEWMVGTLSPAGRQMVEICRAVAQGASLLIFDEPTSSLSDAESQEVFRIVRTLRDRAASVIYITHRMDELREVGGRVTVLRDGETVFAGEMAEVSTAELIRHMVGRSVETIHRREALAPGREMLRVENLSRRGVLHDISLTLRAGEITGLAGLIGAGRTELCRCLFGVDRADSGGVFIEGRAVRIHSPRDAVRAGLALIPEDRQKEGLAAGLPVRHNLLMASMERVSRFGLIDAARERELVGPDADQLAGKLSGGNQQKVVIRKWVLSGAKVVLFDEPTRGIDVGAKVEVFEAMDRMARDGAALLMVSSELPELMQVADRILVMRQGRITAELARGCTQEEIMRHAALESEP